MPRSKVAPAVSYTVDEVRAAASGTSFFETDHNEASRVISFKDQSGSRVNVYYTTGTVGTCLNHPAKGKTQLFRRNVSLDLLGQIFRNPRIHTDTGYYRKNLRQSWKCIQEDGREVFEVDSARRWRYVASVTGLARSPQELARIAKFCNLYDSLMWERGQEPRLKDKRYSCGSAKVLIDMIMVALEEVLGYPVMAVDQGMDPDGPDIRPGGIPCCRGRREAFLEDHERDVQNLKYMLQGFRKIVRIEMIKWFFTREYCRYRLVSVDSGNSIVTSRTDDVRKAHFDYAEIAYTKKDIGRMCGYHGVVWDDR